MYESSQNNSRVTFDPAIKIFMENKPINWVSGVSFDSKNSLKIIKQPDYNL
jgi:hypothetical protein